MSHERSRRSMRVLLAAVIAYGAASLLHHVHNAAFLDEYPNLPAWLTRAQVYAAWLGVATVGVLGWLLVRTRYVLAGLAVLASYAALGLYGLAHYAAAPLAAHTLTMNLSIGLEVAMALLLLGVVASQVVSRIRHAPRSA